MSLTNVVLRPITGKGLSVIALRSFAGRWLSVIVSCCLDRDMRVLGWSPYEKNLSPTSPPLHTCKVSQPLCSVQYPKGNSVLNVFGGRRV